MSFFHLMHYLLNLLHNLLNMFLDCLKKTLEFLFRLDADCFLLELHLNLLE